MNIICSVIGLILDQSAQHVAVSSRLRKKVSSRRCVLGQSNNHSTLILRKVDTANKTRPLSEKIIISGSSNRTTYRTTIGVVWQPEPVYEGPLENYNTLTKREQRP